MNFFTNLSPSPSQDKSVIFTMNYGLTQYMREFLSGLDTNEFFSVFKNPWKVRKTIHFIFKLLWSFGWKFIIYFAEVRPWRWRRSHDCHFVSWRGFNYRTNQSSFDLNFTFEFLRLYYRHSQIRNYTFYIPLDNQEYLISSFISGFRNKLSKFVLTTRTRPHTF